MTNEQFKKEVVEKSKNKYKTELINALMYLDDQVYQMGSYGEERQAQKDAIELLLEFVNNRI